MNHWCKDRVKCWYIFKKEWNLNGSLEPFLSCNCSYIKLPWKKFTCFIKICVFGLNLLWYESYFGTHTENVSSYSMFGPLIWCCWKVWVISYRNKAKKCHSSSLKRHFLSLTSVINEQVIFLRHNCINLVKRSTFCLFLPFYSL